MGESEHNEDEEPSESPEEGEDKYNGQEGEKDEHKSRQEKVVEHLHNVLQPMF